VVLLLADCCTLAGSWSATSAVLVSIGGLSTAVAAPASRLTAAVMPTRIPYRWMTRRNLRRSDADPLIWPPLQSPAPHGPAPDAQHGTTGQQTATTDGAAADGHKIGLLAGTIIFAACAVVAVFVINALDLGTDTAEHPGEHIPSGNAQ
jgi:hypothetical protein